MLMSSANHSLFTFVLLLTVVVFSPLISSVSNSAYASAVNSTYPVSNTTTTTNLIAQDNNSFATGSEITDKLKALIKDKIDSNRSNAALAIGFIDPDGTQFYGYGKLSNSSNATVNENTIFSIGSITKVFTTILLADMVNSCVNDKMYPSVN